MPVKCPWCETNTHSDEDREQYPVCERNFLTKSEAWHIIAENKPHDAEIHVFSNPKENMLIGADWGRDAIKELIEECKYIERCDPDGMARNMKHGLSIVEKNETRWFVETDEKLLKDYEELYINGTH